ncbi:MAG: nicotinate phosphoribosyltransferase [Chloroflexi bacterium]|nr:MAG: nicotinate phosphoribosyltransferase [Chloroflexota bacterium]
MSLFDDKRLNNRYFKLDIDGLRRGYYTDKYFENVVRILSALSKNGYTYEGHYARAIGSNLQAVAVGDIEVEAQIFNRRAPRSLIAGTDVALAMLRYATGYWRDEGDFVETYHQLDVRAVEDGIMTHYDGDPMNVHTVLIIRGRYRDFAILETPILGVLTRASRIATNVYDVLEVSNGKPVLFFPARFDLPAVQELDGYAYWLAVQRYNADFNQQMRPIVSTDAQAAWWGGRGGGTVPHALIACFLADTAEAMVNFARYIPVEVPRIALVDFNNDTLTTTRQTLEAFWPHYFAAYQNGDDVEMRRWRLNGVRLDTSSALRDASLEPDGPKGVNPQLVSLLREAINTAWESWDVPSAYTDLARDYCRQVQIVVSGGFNRERIAHFESVKAPVDAYGVGSTFLSNDKTTNTDFTMDVVRIKIDGDWVEMAKVGRQPCDNPDLRPVNWEDYEDVQ